MPASFTIDPEALIDQLARDNDQLSKENARLNQIVDAFVSLTGRIPPQYDITFSPNLHLTREQKREAAEAAMRAIRDNALKAAG